MQEDEKRVGDGNYRFFVKHFCFVCEKPLGLIISKTADVSETILEKEELTRSICAECVKSDKHGLDLDEVKEGDPLRQKYGESKETILTQYENIRGPAQRLFRALVQKDMPAHLSENFCKLTETIGRE